MPISADMFRYAQVDQIRADSPNTRRYVRYVQICTDMLARYVQIRKIRCAQTCCSNTCRYAQTRQIRTAMLRNAQIRQIRADMH